MNKSAQGEAKSVNAVLGVFAMFFASPMFFLLLGIGFLATAFKLIDSTHPTFVFLLAILGVSIVLYGTGTQAVGSAELKNIPIKAVVAGGAGVLAAVFGFGVAWLGKDIQNVFKVPHEYAKITLELDKDALERTKTVPPDLRKLLITARTRDNRPVHVLTFETYIELLVPVTYFPERVGICVNLTLPPDDKSVTGTPNCPVKLTWRKNDSGDLSDPVTYLGTGNLPLIASKATRVDEFGTPVAQAPDDVFR